jgi:hypothetical protein
MNKIINMFSREVIKDQSYDEKGGFDPELAFAKKSGLEEAASNVCSAAAKLAIECELDTFENYLGDLMSAIRKYQILKR